MKNTKNWPNPRKDVGFSVISEARRELKQFLKQCCIFIPQTHFFLPVSPLKWTRVHYSAQDPEKKYRITKIFPIDSLSQRIQIVIFYMSSFMVVFHPHTREQYSQHNNNFILWIFLISIHENTIVNITTIVYYGCISSLYMRTL